MIFTKNFMTFVSSSAETIPNRGELSGYEACSNTTSEVLFPLNNSVARETLSKLWRWSFHPSGWNFWPKR